MITLTWYLSQKKTLRKSFWNSLQWPEEFPSSNYNTVLSFMCIHLAVLADFWHNLNAAPNPDNPWKVDLQIDIFSAFRFLLVRLNKLPVIKDTKRKINKNIHFFFSHHEFYPPHQNHLKTPYDVITNFELICTNFRRALEGSITQVV